MIPSQSEIARRLPLGLIGTLALVAACEWYIAGNDLKFSRLEPDVWNHAGEAARQPRPPGGILFFGDSQANVGFSPRTIEAKLGRPARNLAIMGGQPPASYFLLRRALESGPKPTAIVIDFEVHLLRDKVLNSSRMWAELADLREIAELSRETGDPDAFAAMALSSLLPSYRRRIEVRDNLMAAFRGETPSIAALIRTARRNREVNRGASLLSRSGVIDHDVSLWAFPGEKPWAPSPLNEQYARKFLDLAREREIPVYCALMPVDVALLRKLIHFGLEGPYIAWLRGLRDRYPNLTVLDWRWSFYGSDVFMDALHLNVDGAVSISTALGDYLRNPAPGVGPEARWVKMPIFRLDGTEMALEDFTASAVIASEAEAKKRR